MKFYLRTYGCFKTSNVKKKIKRKNRFFVYIVQCRDGTYYTGYTNNLNNRINLHNKGFGAKYLRGKGPVRLVYVKEYRYYKNAMTMERYIKKMSRKQKEKLIKNYSHSFTL
ncbi:MAG: GIY-YIG nuclease family protein [Elusimicrobia bacterium]|nr:GIY-YIG nuclease family protein [Elusimicrobiota bacterium]